MEREKFTGRAFLAAVFAALVLSAACEQPAGELPQEGRILNAADLAKIGEDLSHPLSASYTLTADLVLDNWVPLGSGGRPFTGSFDGGGHEIMIRGGRGGIFANTRGAVIRNLAVTGTITAESAPGLPLITGGIAGLAENTLIENCSSGVTIDAAGHGYNTSAGGIAGTLRNRSVIRSCRSTASVRLAVTGSGDDIILHAGGIAGYSGTGSAEAGDSSACLITRCSWQGGEILAEGPYPYAGGVCGYNYAGAKITECSAGGTVTARSRRLSYAGGITGYNSRNAGTSAAERALVENCYSTAAVLAESMDTDAALAGGVTGANAAGALVSKCCARGSVTARIKGGGEDGLGGSLGVSRAANAGGIAGAQYFPGNGNAAPRIEKSAAFNTLVAGVDTGSGGTFNVWRIAGAGNDGTGERVENIAGNGMVLTGAGHADDKGPSGKDGSDCPVPPADAVFAALGWDFTEIWETGPDGYPRLRRAAQY